MPYKNIILLGQKDRPLIPFDLDKVSITFDDVSSWDIMTNPFLFSQNALFLKLPSLLMIRIYSKQNVSHQQFA